LNTIKIIIKKNPSSPLDFTIKGE